MRFHFVMFCSITPISLWLREKLFEKHGYPETREHIEKLKKLVGQVFDFYESFKKSDAEVNFDLMEFLKDWLNNRIKGTDKKYGAFFNFKGVN